MVEMDIHCNVIKCRKPLSLESQVSVLKQWLFVYKYLYHIYIIGMCDILLT